MIMIRHTEAWFGPVRSRGAISLGGEKEAIGRRPNDVEGEGEKRKAFY